LVALTYSQPCKAISLSVYACMQLEDLVNVHEAKIQDLMSALEAKDRQHVAQVTGLLMVA